MISSYQKVSVFIFVFSRAPCSSLLFLSVNFRQKGEKLKPPQTRFYLFFLARKLQMGCFEGEWPPSGDKAESSCIARSTRQSIPAASASTGCQNQWPIQEVAWKRRLLSICEPPVSHSLWSNQTLENNPPFPLDLSRQIDDSVGSLGMQRWSHNVSITITENVLACQEW